MQMRIRTLSIAIVAGIIALTSVACSNPPTPINTVKTTPATVALKPLATNDDIVVGSDQQLRCGDGLKPISLTGPLGTSDSVEGTDVRIVKKNAISMTSASSEAIYTSDGPLPQVRGLIVTFITPEQISPYSWPPIPPVKFDFRATWPEQAAKGPVSVSVKSNDFTGKVLMINAVMFCTS